MAEPCVLGIDGGGSKTLLALATRDGTVVRCWSGAGTNPFDAPDWRSRLLDLAGQAGVVGAASAGLAGYGEAPEVSAAQEAALEVLLAGPVPRSVHNDVQVAFDGAFGAAPGVLVLAGTGSMVWAQDAAGRSVRVGGWGHGIGDAGSAFAIGQRTVQLLSEVLDGRSDARPFAEAMFAVLGLPPEGAALIGWYYGHPHLRPAVAALAREVDALAAGGCPVAAGLLHEAAEQLRRQMEAARGRLPGAGTAWSHAGGLFNSVLLRDALAAQFGPPVPPRLPPVGGALWRAATLAGWDAGPAWTARLAASLSRLNAGALH